ncbi:MAG TPA: aldo/keto reductase [Solirubrobacterales bacterium]|nr:aldo/keto reductase [Solirubrobacterales bacterium]
MQAAQTTVPGLTLRDRTEIPQLGFGLFQVPPEKTQATVELALEAGYRHFDTAAAYRNEKELGAALAVSGLSREDYFVTTKLSIPHQDPDSTLAAFEASLDRLGLDHVDLYLIHWPGSAAARLLDTWRALEWIHREEAARSIGVSNFSVEELELLERETETLPAVNQVELHPRLQQAELRAHHAAQGIATEAWAPLAQGALLVDGTIVRLARGRGKTPAQVILRWHLQRGNIAIPKSVAPKRIRENIDLFDFELSNREMAAIGDLDSRSQIAPRSAAFARLS